MFSHDELSDDCFVSEFPHSVVIFIVISPLNIICQDQDQIVDKKKKPIELITNMKIRTLNR